MSGGGLFRIFDVDKGGTPTIKDLTLTHGNGGLDPGGAIRVGRNAQLSVENVRFRENAAKVGGAIGARGQYKSMRVVNSSFQGNSAEQGGAISLGIDEATIEGSSFIRNRSQFGGGALSVGSHVTLTHLTLVNNMSPAYEGRGRALNVSGTVHMHNIIIVGGRDPLCNGRLAGNIANFIEDGSCSAPMGGEARLGELTGSPAHHPPLDGSTALDNADQRFCSDTDQLGTPRPQGQGCDLGAIESTTAVAVPTPVPTVCPLPD